jgi:hypothetical protein
MTDATDSAEDEGEPVSEVVTEFDRRLDAAQQLIRDASADPPEVLYHYTSAKGLLDIVEAARLRASDVLHMNDREELELGRRTIAEIAGGALPDASSAWLRPLGQPCSVFAFSLSRERDSLPQWRAYAADGLGYSLGLATSALPEIVGVDKNRIQLFPEFIGPELRRVLYKRKEQQDLVCAVLDQIGSASRWFEAENPDEDDRRIGVMIHGSALSSCLGELYAMFKNEAFETEREWRYVVWAGVPRPKAAFRPTPFGITPYLELWFGEKLPLRAITMGPKVSAAVGEASLKNFLWGHGYQVDPRFKGPPGTYQVPTADPVSITPSAATYR